MAKTSRSIQRASDMPCFARLMASLAGSKSAIYCIYNLLELRSSRAEVPCHHPLKTAFRPAAISAETIREEHHDLRNPRLSRPAGTAAGANKTLRDHHAQAVGKARHQAGRVLHHAGRRIQPGADLYSGLVVARRPREEVGCICDRSGMADGARQNRRGRPDRRQHRQSIAGADLVLGDEITSARADAFGPAECLTVSTISCTPGAIATQAHESIAAPASPSARATAMPGAPTTALCN